jgi:hypothetical protein
MSGRPVSAFDLVISRRGRFVPALLLLLIFTFAICCLSGCCKKKNTDQFKFVLDGPGGANEGGRRTSHQTEVRGGDETRPKVMLDYKTHGTKVRSERLVALNEAGLKAFEKSKKFRSAESLYAEGKYQDALGEYQSATSELGDNEYIKRRLKNCELAISVDAARNDKILSAIDKSIVDEKPAALDDLVEQISKNDKNPFVRRNYHYYKSIVLEKSGSLDRAAEEYVRYILVDQEISKSREDAWTPALEPEE